MEQFKATVGYLARMHRYSELVAPKSKSEGKNPNFLLLMISTSIQSFIFLSAFIANILADTAREGQRTLNRVNDSSKITT